MPIRDPKPSTADLPESIHVAFRDQALLSLPATARLLGFSSETLRDRVKAFNLPRHNKGLGTKRPRLAFSLDDVAAIWHSTRQ